MTVKQHILNVEHLEKERYLMECTISKMDSIINGLGRKRIIRRQKNPIPRENTEWNMSRIVIVIIAILYFFLTLPAAKIYIVEGSRFGVWWVPVIAFWLPSILVIALVIRYMKKNQKMYDENDEIITHNYHIDIANDARRVEHEKQMAVCYTNARNKLYQTYTKTCNLLASLYAQNIIYEKYQYNLVAICMFAEYFKSNRCSSLEGHEGAYNIYETEIRMGIIISKLDEIIERLDRIENNQYGLYSALKEIGQTQNRILSNLQDISQNQTKQLENAEYMRYDMQVMRRNSDIALMYGMRYV